MSVELLELGQIRIDGGTQSRAALNNEEIGNYRADMMAGDEFPPVIVFYDGASYWLADGFHRFHATVGISDKIRAEVKQGGQRDAILYGLGSNARHGIRRTNADKRRAVLRLLEDDEWRKWSDREIARRAAVSDRFVNTLRSEHLTANIRSERVYTTKHGTVATMQTANIGAGPPSQNGITACETCHQLYDAARLGACPYCTKTASERIGGLEAHQVQDRDIRRDARRNAQLSEALRTRENVYSVIYADPPWRYEHSKTNNRQIENHYPTMTLEQICALEVPAASDAILYLWATAPKLQEAMSVIDAWGFSYRTCMVWDKEVIGMGYWARSRHELLLVATKGAPITPRPEDRAPSVYAERRGPHSAKPEYFCALIERMYPALPKLELFARRKRAGWETWGNEV